MLSLIGLYFYQNADTKLCHNIWNRKMATSIVCKSRSKNKNRRGKAQLGKIRGPLEEEEDFLMRI